MATELLADPDNYVNVAKVDCHENQDVGRRFDIEGYPTIKMFHKGKMYTYSGKKEKGEIVEFARGNFKFEVSEDVPANLGLFGDILKILKHACRTAVDDYNSGNYFTKDILLVSMPFLFIASMLLILMLPIGQAAPSVRERKLRDRKKNDLAEPDDDIDSTLSVQ